MFHYNFVSVSEDYTRLRTHFLLPIVINTQIYIYIYIYKRSEVKYK